MACKSDTRRSSNRNDRCLDGPPIVIKAATTAASTKIETIQARVLLLIFMLSPFLTYGPAALLNNKKTRRRKQLGPRSLLGRNGYLTPRPINYKPGWPRPRSR